ncbi:MAG: restriction endonuclease subunit S [bacterium]|nr:restriction endonuclease subunit S [bacterium]
MNNKTISELIDENILFQPIDGNHGEYHPKASDYVTSGIPFIMASDINNGLINYKTCKYITKEQSLTLPKGFAIEGDVLLTHKATIGRTAIVSNIKDDYIMLTPQVTYYRIKDPNVLNNVYLKYYFDSPTFQKRIKKYAGCGSTRAYIGILDQQDLSIEYPDISTQKNIANILYTIDEKINTNNNIYCILENITKTIYDYWFVQFDFPNIHGKPYKSNGGTMIYNEVLKKEIPIDWEIDNLYRIADFFNGLACQKYRPKENEEYMPVVKIGEMHNGITEETEFVRKNIPDKNKIYAGDILFSWSATLEVMLWTGVDAGLNQHIFKVVPKESYTKEYVYQQLSAYVNNFVRIAEARKTTMGHITTDHLEQSKIVIPPTELINKYTEKVKDIYKQMILCKQENLSLANLRDFLLPMLMNGQITVMVSDEDDLSEDKIIEKSLEFWQTHGKMNIDQFARENGILVYKDNEQKKGAVSYNKEKDLYEIAVKDPRDNFTIAHEIGHILKHKKELKNGTLGRKSEESGSKLMEYEADSLAAEILMPEEYVLQYVQDENKTDKEFLDEKFIKECAKHFDVNPLAMNIRLKNLGFKTPYIR